MHYDDYEYCSDWQSVSRSEYPEQIEPMPDEEEEESIAPAVKTAKTAASKQLLLTLQLAACVLLALAAFVLKNTGGETYRAVREWYYRQINSSIISDGDRGFDLGRMFSSATADEAAD